VTKPQTETPPFEKEVIRMPDGRELTYYRFPEETSPQGGNTPERPAPGEER
jgi:hypothetical protein